MVQKPLAQVVHVGKSWHAHPNNRCYCEFCGNQIGKSVWVQRDGKKYRNTPKTCFFCRKKGCLCCMVGNLEHGILRHQDCVSSEEKLETAGLGSESPFEVLGFRVVISSNGATSNSEAVIKIRIGDKVEYEADKGNGPINALDNSLRKTLSRILSDSSILDEIRLIDYQVSVINGQKGTAASVKVDVIFGNKTRKWRSVAGGTNIIETSF